MVWKERNDRFFKDVEQIDQMLKFSFLCLFLEWVRVGLDEVTMSMVDLADYFFISCFFCFDLAFGALICDWRTLVCSFYRRC